MAFDILLPLSLLYSFGIDRITHIVLVVFSDKLSGSVHIQLVHWSNGDFDGFNIANDQNDRALGAQANRYHSVVHPLSVSLGRSLERHVRYRSQMGDASWWLRCRKN